MNKFLAYTFISKMVLKVPVIVVSVLLGLPVAFIRACIIGVIEVSDTMLDMVLDVSKIDELNKKDNDG